jgi:hypothetical protein
MLDLKIDPQLHDLFDPLPYEDFEKLKASIKELGCIEPLIIWKGHNTIVDGHNRYKICKDLGIEFSVTQRPFESLNHALLWANNHGNVIDIHRHESEASKRARYKRIKPVFEAIARENKRILSETNKGKVVRDCEQPDRNEPAYKQAAKSVGLPQKKAERSDYIDKHGTPEVIADVDAGKMSINEGFEVVKYKKKYPKALTHSLPDTPDTISKEKCRNFVAACQKLMNFGTHYMCKDDDNPDDVAYAMKAAEVVVNHLTKMIESNGHVMNTGADVIDITPR